MRMRRVVICGLFRVYNIFPHYLKNGGILENKKLLNLKYDFQFSLQMLSEIFLILRRI